MPTLVPLGAALWSWSAVDAALLEHLRSYVLPAAVANTAILLLLVLVGVLVVGVVSAGLVALTDFPGRALFSFLLLLPLALPGYVVAIAFLGLLDQGGGFLPGLPEWMPEVRNRYGLSLVLTASLYPYVFLITREAFQSQGLRAIEAARSVGLPAASGLREGGLAPGAALDRGRRQPSADGSARGFRHRRRL